jgi:hypothetical protein
MATALLMNLHISVKQNEIILFVWIL